MTPIRDRLAAIATALLGTGTAADPAPEDLLELGTAAPVLRRQGYDSLDVAGLCFGQVDSLAFEQVRTDLETMLAASEPDGGADYRLLEDEYGYGWVVLEDIDFDNLLHTGYAAADTLIEAGYGRHLLCAVFGFAPRRDRTDEESSSHAVTGQSRRNRSGPDDDRDPATVYWLFNFKRGRWYPFVPDGARSRDVELEYRQRDLLAGEVDLEDDDARRYPFWGIPF